MIKNLSVYIATSDGFEILYAGTEKKVNDFMRFWTQFRPLAKIEVRDFDTMDGVRVIYHGESIGYLNSRR